MLSASWSKGSFANCRADTVRTGSQRRVGLRLTDDRAGAQIAVRRCWASSVILLLLMLPAASSAVEPREDASGRVAALRRLGGHRKTTGVAPERSRSTVARPTSRPLPQELEVLLHDLAPWVTGVSPVRRDGKRSWLVPWKDRRGYLADPEVVPPPIITSERHQGQILLTITVQGAMPAPRRPVSESQWLVQVTPPSSRRAESEGGLGARQRSQWERATANWKVTNRLSLQDASRPGQQPAIPRPGRQFRLWRPSAKGVRVLIDGLAPIQMIEDPRQPLTGHWVCDVPSEAAGRGYRFELIEPGTDGADRLVELEDPYAPDMAPNGFGSRLAAREPTRSRIAPQPRGGSPPLPHKPSLIIETTLRGLTARDPDLDVSQRGTPEGVIQSRAVGRLLEDLAPSHLELLPVHSFGQLGGAWGYYSKGWFSFQWPREQLRKMVAFLRERGIEVIVDVVFNHQDGAVVVKAWGKDMLHLKPDGGILNPSGVGEALDTRNPRIRRLFIDALFELYRLGIRGARVDCALGHAEGFYREARRVLPRDMLLILEGSGLEQLWSEGDFDTFFKGLDMRLWDHGMQNSHLTANGVNRRRGPPEFDEPPASNLDGTLHALFGGAASRIGYAECHDNYTLPKRLTDAGHVGAEWRARLLAGHWLVQAAQAPPMITLQGVYGDSRFRGAKRTDAETQEVMRNPWDDADANAVAFPLVEKNRALVRAVGDMARFRRATTHFSYAQDPVEGRDWRRLGGTTQSEQGAVVGAELQAPDRKAPPLVLLFNGERDGKRTVELPDGGYRVVADSDGLRNGLPVIDPKGLPGRRPARGSVALPAGSAMLLLRENAPVSAIMGAD